MVNNNHGGANSKSNHSKYLSGYGCECLTPFPLLRFQLYCGGKFNRWWKPEYTNNPNNLLQFDKCYQIWLYRIYLGMSKN